MPDYNVVLAKQIRETFNDEVLFTLCTNENDIAIFYRLRERQSKIAEAQSEVNSDKAENSDTSLEINPKGTFRKSRMRMELVKLCKKTRKNTKEKEKACEQ